jgi:hypothetical protein
VLSNATFGDALSSLSPIHTNSSTSKGFAITPFKFNYLGSDNDFTTGELFTMTFDIGENVADGSYIVALNYARDKDVNYYDGSGNVLTKNLYIDNAEVEIKNNSVAGIVIVNGYQYNSTTWVVLLVLAIGIVLGLGIFVATRLFRKQRNWEKL